MKNKKLISAKIGKNDEFYTQLSDVENEMKYYKHYFKDKTVFCNCDDPYESNFFKYFATNFNFLGLKKLIATCYGKSKIVGTQLTLDDKFGENIPISDRRIAHKIVITEVKDETGKCSMNLSDVKHLIESNKNTLTMLEGDGDFRSPECIELLKEADVVVTNPPFSLFREYVAQLMEYNKKFIILGNQNAITYKEIFPLIKENKIWLGISIQNGSKEFQVPNSYSLETSNCRIDERGNKYIKVSGICWFTNLDVQKRHQLFEFGKKYDSEEYPKYDNYDAIEVKATKLIPENYYGVMGVPITFMYSYCPEQFEILGITDRANTSGLRTKKYTVDEVPNANDLNARSVIKENGKYKAVYARILIKRR